MAVTDTDLLLVQRGTVPYKTTADEIASYTNNKIELGENKDIPIASASQLGVIKVGTNLDIESDGTLNAVIPAGLTYKGTWTDADNPPTPADNGDFYIWDGGNGSTLNNALWGSENGETVNDGDRLFYDGTSWAIVPGGGGGLQEITGTAPVVVSAVVDGEQDVSMPAANSTTDGYMPKEAWDKLDGIEPGAEANIDPTQTFTATAVNGTLTLQPGGDTTVIPGATDTVAGLMTAAQVIELGEISDKIDDLTTNPGGILSLVEGPGITINTASAPGTPGTPQIIAKIFAPAGTADATTQLLPSNLNLLEDLP